MADSITIDQLTDAVTKEVKLYTEAVDEGIAEELLATTTLVLKEVKSTAPKRTGKYARSFIATDESIIANRRYAIWSKKNYRRVHLLEFGHAKKNGGRVEGRPHLGPAYDKYVPEMEDNIKKIITNGGRVK